MRPLLAPRTRSTRMVPRTLPAISTTASAPIFPALPATSRHVRSSERKRVWTVRARLRWMGPVGSTCSVAPSRARSAFFRPMQTATSHRFKRSPMRAASCWVLRSGSARERRPQREPRQRRARASIGLHRAIRFAPSVRRSRPGMEAILSMLRSSTSAKLIGGPSCALNEKRVDTAGQVGSSTMSRWLVARLSPGAFGSLRRALSSLGFCASRRLLR